MSSEIDVVAGQYYPVRIQYSQAALTMLYNFNVYILKMEGTGQRVKWKFDVFLFSHGQKQPELRTYTDGDGVAKR
jgi:hypothetical protein